MRGNNNQDTNYGFRIYNREFIEETHSYAPNLSNRTFHPTEGGYGKKTKGDLLNYLDKVESIVRTIEAVVRKSQLAHGSPVNNPFGELVEEVEHLAMNDTPIFAKAHNALGTL